MTTRLKNLASLVTTAASSGPRPYVALEHVEGGTGRLVDGLELPTRLGADAGSVAIESGDVLFGKLRPYLAKTWRADRAAYASTELMALRPRRDVESRWLGYLMSSRPVIEWSVSTSEGSKMPRTSWEKLAAYRQATVPPLAEQRAIADFLDRETARIDALIAAKRRMVEVLEERRSAQFAVELDRCGFRFPASLQELGHVSLPQDWRVIRLSQVLRQLTNGYVGPTRDILVDQGVRYVQSLHIKSGTIDFDRRPFYVSEDWHRDRPRIHLRTNDVLVVQTGDIGQVAVVPEGFGEASCHALQILRVRPDLVTGPFLGAYLRSDFGYHSLLSMATGALHPHLEGSIRAVPIVVPPIGMQGEIIARADAGTVPLRRNIALIDRQVGLLVERRQALITAAVTGELEVPGVAA